MGLRLIQASRKKNLLIGGLTGILVGILLNRCFPVSSLFSLQPLSFGDYTHHFYKAFASNKFLTLFGRMSGYDPFFMAGYPGGGIMALDSKLWELLVWLLGQVLPFVIAFKVTVFFSFCLSPLLVYSLGRKFGFSYQQAIGAVWGWMLLWFLDPALFNFWKLGLFSWIPASLLAVWAGACWSTFFLTGFLCWRDRILSGIASIIALWMHVLSPVVFFVLLGTGISLSPFSLRKFSLLFLPIFLCVAAAALPLLLPLFSQRDSFLHVSQLSKGVYQSGFANLGQELLLDYSRLAVIPLGSHRLKLALFFLAGWGIKNDQNRDRSRFFLVTGSLFFFISYLGRYLPFLKETQPYRFTVPLLAFLLFPAVLGLKYFIGRFSTLPTDYRRLTFFFLLVLIPVIGANIRVSQACGQLTVSFTKENQALLNLLADQTDRRGRILFPIATGTLLPAALPCFLKRELVGGFFQEIYSIHNLVNATSSPAFWFGHQRKNLTEEMLKHYFDRYNVQWVVAEKSDAAYYRSHGSLFEKIGEAGFWDLYRTSVAPSFFLQGSGVLEAGFEGIAVQKASVGTVILKYHWDEKLISDPPLVVSKYTVPGDPVGFIRVDNNQVKSFVLRFQSSIF